MTHHWPVQSKTVCFSLLLLILRPVIAAYRPKPLSLCGQTPQRVLRLPTGFQIYISKGDKKKESINVLRCSGTPRISGKLFTGLSVGRTAALCIIVIQTGR